MRVLYRQMVKRIRRRYVKLGAAHPLIVTIIKKLGFIVLLPITIPAAMIGLVTMALAEHIYDDFVVPYQIWRDDIKREAEQDDD